MRLAGLTHALARGVVRMASWSAPPGSRDAFVREWEGELASEAAEAGPERALVAALGAFADARALRELHGRGGRAMGTWASGLPADVAVALRGLRRAPGFAAVAILTLALGLGGSAALYTLLDRAVLSPLPYPDAERLVRLENQVPGVGPKEVWRLSTAQWVYLTDHATTLEEVGLYRGSGGNVMTPLGPERVRSASVTAGMMGILGARAAAGRLLTADDDTPAAPLVALVSRGFWERVLGGDPSVAGSTLSYNDNPVEIVGVLEEGVELPGWPFGQDPEVWFPMRVDRGGRFFNNHAYLGVARMTEGATPETVMREMEAFRARLPEAFPDAYSQGFFDRYGFRTRAVPLKESILGDLARNLWILLGGVGLVLLIACANVANLFVVRMEGRRRELDVRAALGAGMGDLGRYVLAEGMTLAFLGAVAALLLAYWAVPAITALAPPELPRIHGATLGIEPALVTLALGAVVGLLLTAYPLAIHLGRAGSLASGGRSVTAGRPRQRMRAVTVVTQVALALTLIVGAGLLLESLARLRRADAGIEPRGVLALDLYLSYARHGTDADVWGVYRQILDRVRALPGVTSAGMSQELPVSGRFGCTVQGFEDAAVYQDMKDRGLTTCAGQEPATPGYFETLGIPVLEGRDFDDLDNDDPTRGAVVVSKAFAERFWPGRSALGQGVAPSGNTQGPFYHVVGVVDDVARSASEGEPPLGQPAIAIYYPIRHDPAATWNRGWWPGQVSLVVRTGLADPASLFPSIRQAVAEVDPEIPVTNLTNMESVVAGATSELAFVSLLLAIAAATALLLAAVGLYGVLSYVVSRRTREIGMRMAVGARPSDVRGMVVRGSMTLVGSGLALGTAVALGASRVVAGLLVGVEPTQPAVYVAAASVLALVALVASWLPAWRASRIDPVEALRSE